MDTHGFNVHRLAVCFPSDGVHLLLQVFVGGIPKTATVTDEQLHEFASQGGEVSSLGRQSATQSLIAAVTACAACQE